MSTSPDLGLPFIAAGQAQPEVTYAEALIRLQALVMGAIELGVDTPPASPTAGDVYVLGTVPTGDWDGKANKVAIYYGGSWRFVPDVDSDGADIPMGLRHEGLSIFVRGSLNLLMVWNGSTWAPVA